MAKKIQFIKKGAEANLRLFSAYNPELRQT